MKITTEEYEEMDGESMLPYMDTPEERMELLSYKGNKCRLRTTISGPIVEAELFPVYGESDATPAQKKKRTVKQEREVYERRQRKRLTRLINANFGIGDTWATVDYAPEHLPSTFADARKNVQNFIQRVIYYCKKHNLPKLKYVYCTAQYDTQGKPVRFHHHIILNFRERDVLESLWHHGGRPNTRRLVPDKDGLEGMARYIAAQGHCKKAFCVSLGLKEPVKYTADSKVTARQAVRMMQSSLFAEEKLRKLYPNFELISIESRFNPNGGGFYVYAKLRKPFDIAQDEAKQERLSELQVKRLRVKLDSISGTAKELESLKRELIHARGSRIKIVKSNITRLTKSHTRLRKWFDTVTKKMERIDRALLRDRYINDVSLEELARRYYYTDKSAVFRKINKLISETFPRGNF